MGERRQVTRDFGRQGTLTISVWELNLRALANPCFPTLLTLLRREVHWEEIVVEELTDFAERCLGGPNRRPRARDKLGDLQALCDRYRC